ncbi:hypothetical protein [Formosa sp. PL04]|uniref:hypothetical protein n=1 Tax=Formosa sp. PL04 TaxID=3081755 RepID=UPI002982527F|nr:hypothetical protein [Formosa sp. PL04]MDW5291024.1 hypothetical protein [Formosa sp. PL04]
MKRMHFILLLVFLNLGTYSCSPETNLTDENTTADLDNCCGDDGDIDIPPPDDQNPK